jgi:Fur family ferric uptake transcriptional regulator
MSTKELKEVGLKATLPRLKILEILESSEGGRHMSAEEVYDLLRTQDDKIGLATIYRVLTQFEQAGLVTRHNFEGGHAVFELNEGKHHDHILCVKCGRVDEFVDETIEQRQQAIAEKHGYSITDHSLIIYGICGACQKK